MIIDCISDLHGFIPKLEGGDLLLVAGDLMAHESEMQLLAFFDWLESLPYKKIVLIAGNHDNILQDDKRPILPRTRCGEQKVFYLQDSGTEFEGLKIWGSPWSKQFPGINPNCCAFTVPRDVSLAKKWDIIPADTDILMVHSPALYILDKNQRGVSCGDFLLRLVLDRVKPKLFVFGHIHEEGGKRVIYKHEDGKETLCVNASIMNEYYEPRKSYQRVFL